MKKFDDWNEVKKQVHSRNSIIHFKEREVYWASIGENVGFEQNGKGSDFSRPVLIIKKLNNHLFFGVPLSTQNRSGSFFYEFELLPDKISTALLVQAKVYDVKRLDQKIGMIQKDDFEKLNVKLKELLGF
ncbi:type II toxin-antitoxin system PemK/MazF family toxin [Sulfuricurvum sp.]|uniref:type II toxin-antitoxin system PemK/MazF family toxin n=1 Tax=Sulfuricurvum sp. TaxID=2025608 RepID=UPI00261DC4B6|nr:type II toxin-antitoxin system PemK/MazF family toxin [Sulfuricurvum sp.]MDD2781409.1 type II toxin-antitoxin system PemK/MazF family toxin [Sulfuricurvum sp.]